MTGLGSAEQRLLDGLWAGAGRTLVLAGLPGSGKTAALDRLRAEFGQRGGRLHELRGEYRFRDLPFAAMETLDRAAEPAPEAGETPPGEASDSPLAAMAFVPMEVEAPAAGRRRSPGRSRGPHLLPPAGRNPVHVDPDEFWRSRLSELRTDPHAPVLLVVDEAAFVDAESREVLLYLSERAPLRPVGLVLSLDPSVPAFARWEERLVGHSDVDWIRLEPQPDPREARRFLEAYDLLPAGCRRVLALASLLGGRVSEVVLSRVTRSNYYQLAEALLPAVEAGLVRLSQGHLEFAHAANASVIPSRWPATELAEMHREIAEALAALNPEPRLERRLELAHHYFEWYKGPSALRYLLETAELTERLAAFDTATEALERALECVPSLPAPERLEAETEIRFLEVRALASAGELSAAEEALRQGAFAALAAEGPPERLVEWTESLLPTLRLIGPRPSLVTLLIEIAERSHEASAREVEILLQSAIAGYDLDRGRLGKAREEARRAARLASGAAAGVPQAMALEAVGRSRLEGSPEEQAIAERFLTTAKRMLAATRRFVLEQQVEADLIELQHVRGDREGAKHARERALAQAERSRNLPMELEHRLELAALLLDDAADARAAALLRRAREIAGLFHLLPPSPPLLKLWLLEGRFEAKGGNPAAARDRFEAVAEQPSTLVAARPRAEARLRLALLEASLGRDEAARPQLRELARPELREALRPEWREWLRPLYERLGETAASVVTAPNAPGSTA